ncbi:MAG: hypothetical protein HQL87_01970 [Magnetococcales bacterium]|nr:hypothetical protein [Magnetococcales bacterium]
MILIGKTIKIFTNGNKGTDMDGITPSQRGIAGDVTESPDCQAALNDTGLMNKRGIVAFFDKVIVIWWIV